MQNKTARFTLTTAFICLIIISTIFLSACTNVTYSVVSASDGSYYYDVSIDLSGVNEEIYDNVVNAIKTTAQALPLYSKDHTCFVEKDKQLIYRESYQSLTDVYLARGYTGYESNSTEGYEITDVGILYQKYTRSYDNFFAVIDAAYSKSRCSELALADSRYEFATYYEHGIKNIERLFLVNLAKDIGWSEMQIQEALSHGLIYFANALGLSGDTTKTQFTFVYGTDKKSVTTNAPKVINNTDTVTPVYDELYKDNLYYHVWSGDESQMLAESFTVSQTSPKAAVWYIISIILTIIISVIIIIAVRISAKSDKKTRTIAPRRTDTLKKDENPFN